MNGNEIRKPEKHILIIDDTLDMDLQRHGLIKRSEDSDCIMRHDNIPVDITVYIVENKQRALARLSALQAEGISRDNLIVISDYKLQVSGKEELGTDILQAIVAQGAVQPSKIFLMSKSGFRIEDQPKLDSIGAQYFHSNELFFAVAAGAGNESLKEVFSQSSKTNIFRSWCNKNFGTNFTLGQYRSPDIKAVERGNIPVQEVVRRIKANEVNYAEAMQLLDKDSVRAAFRSSVGAVDISQDKIVSLQYGVDGPSVQGRLAFSNEDIHLIRSVSPSDPIIFVLENDYTPKDHEAIGQAAAVVMLGSGTKHIQVLAKNQGIAVLFANRGKYPELSVNNKMLQKLEEPLPSFNFAGVGDWLTVEGSKYQIYADRLPITEPFPEVLVAAKEMAQLSHYYNSMTWHFKESAEKITNHTGVMVMANADNAAQVALAKKNPDVRGIGLLRTEHMFLSEDRRLLLLKALICEGEAKASALADLIYEHTRDLEPVFALQDKKFPIQIRLFDFPPEEFFPNPKDKVAIVAIAAALKVNADKLENLCAGIYDKQLRGAAFAEAFPEIAQAQCTSIFAAAKNKEPNIIVPVVRKPEQIKFLRDILDISSGSHGNLAYSLGAMVETREMAPEDCGKVTEPLEEMVKKCDFLCLGTNDLSEEILGVKRGDLLSVLEWQQKSREPINPFDELASKVKDTITRILNAARLVNPELKMTLCGDQATSRSTAEFCQHSCLSAISVPANPEMLTQALVETGRSALLEATAQRERRHREEGEITLKAALVGDGAIGKLPDDVNIVSKHVLAQSATAFIILEDDSYLLNCYAEELEGCPVLLCENVSDTLYAIEAMLKQGKQVRLYADANVPLVGYVGNTNGSSAHPLCKIIKENSYGNHISWGAELARAIAEDNIAQMNAGQVAIFSEAVSGSVPQGVSVHGKSRTRDVIEFLKQEIDTANALSTASRGSEFQR